MKEDVHKIFLQLLNAKEEVARLEREYRRICDCNEKLPGDIMDNGRNDYRKVYKTCHYHKVKFERNLAV